MWNRAIFGALLSLSALLQNAAQGQTVPAAQEAWKPYDLSSDDSQLRARGASAKNPSAYTSTYVLVYRGPQGSSQSYQGSKVAEEYSFPSLNLILSAAAKLMTDELQEPGKIEGKVGTLGELRKLYVNVRVRGLDTNKKPLVSVRKAGFPTDKEPEFRPMRDSEMDENPYVVVLAISPSDSQYRTTESMVSKEMDSINIFTRFMGPIGGLTSGVTAVFKSFFRTKDTPTQVAYLSSEEEFGWSWRDMEGYGIEGIHQCSAFLRIRKEVKYLQVHLDFITDWRRFGAWMRSYDYVIAVPPENVPG